MTMKIRKKKVLVTGAAGFIGSNLVEDLLKHENQVIGLDNLSTGFISNISEFVNNPNFCFIEGDIRDLSVCMTACQGVDIVLHEAALGSVPRSIKDPVTTNSVNIDGFLNMLIAARDNGVRRFVYASSSSVYGDSAEMPKIEERIGKPLSPYAVTKMVDELYAHAFFLNFGMEVIGLRYFNVYGRKQRADGAYAAVIPLFVSKLLKYESPVINGDGTNSRDFTYIDNVIQMNHLAATTENSAALDQVYNTAVGESSNLLELFRLIKKNLAEFDSQIEFTDVNFGPERNGDIPHSLASINKAMNLLGYKPTIKLEEGLKQATNWYWKNRNKRS